MAAVGTLIGASFYFIKTRVGPPLPVPTTRAHYDHVSRDIGRLNSELPIDSLHKYMFQVTHLVGFLSENQLLDTLECDTLKAQAVANFAPRVAEWGLGVLGNSDWRRKDLDEVYAMIKWVKGISRSNGSCFVETLPSAATRFETIDSVSRLYWRAQKLLKQKDFVNLDSSSHVMRQAKAYKKDRYLCHNSRLMDDLDTLAARLDRSHFAYLKGRAMHMKDYKWMGSEEEVVGQYEKYTNEMDQYSRNAVELYGNHYAVTQHLSQLSSLRDTLSKYHRQGVAYYKELERKRESEQIFNIDFGKGFHIEINRE